MVEINTLNKQENQFQKFFTTLFLILFIVQPILKIEVVQDLELRVRAILKIILIVGLCYYAFYFKIKKQILYYIFILASCFIIGQLALNQQYSVFHTPVIDELLKGDIYIALKFLFIFFFVSVYENIKSKYRITEKVITLFKKVVIVNTIFILLGALFSISFFRAYPDTPLRYGYQGLFDLAGESLYLYCIAICIAYFDYLRSRKYVTLFIFIAGGLLLGKKAIFLLLFLLFLVHLWNLKKIKWVVFFFFMALLSVLFIKPIYMAIIKIFPFWHSIYDEYGLVTSIFSTRDILFKQTLSYIAEEWSFLNYLFGGVDFFNIRSEFGFFDLFLTFGAVGILTYILFLKNYFFNGQEKSIQWLLWVILLVEALSGGMLINITPMLLFYLMTNYFKHDSIESHEYSNHNRSPR